MAVRPPSHERSPRHRPVLPVPGGGYVTDGVRLFRVVTPLAPELGIHSAVLEDCATLRWRTYEGSELHRLRLRTVRPQQAATEPGS
ncbi:hypothetical protein FSW04_21505 [Baekduia soli]|uniref:Uncharacterized protein n=1 Tax=Baekduia soli TaxID=496014 RepID=A0A5B8UAQ8_9ACTN|nr:hypothetical protein [Baekduia soli]QEC49888.1 hypothetical protein FSW04_21505 [Baekduia soli]